MRMDLAKLIVALHNFVNMLKNQPSDIALTHPCGFRKKETSL
jgi:hypothetical protein